MRVVERQFSEFLRQPNDVVAELEQHDVLLRRRDAPALRLMRADREDARSEAVQGLARMLRNVALYSHSGLILALEAGFPWVAFLPHKDRATFAGELTEVLVAAAALENFERVAEVLQEWRATAEIHADPVLASRLRKPIDEVLTDHVVRPLGAVSGHLAVGSRVLAAAKARKEPAAGAPEPRTQKPRGKRGAGGSPSR